MSKDRLKDQPQEESQDTPQDQPQFRDEDLLRDIQNTPDEDTAEQYFFPNDGGLTSFSCRADSREEAETRNQEHLEQLKNETE